MTREQIKHAIYGALAFPFIYVAIWVALAFVEAMEIGL